MRLIAFHIALIPLGKGMNPIVPSIMGKGKLGASALDKQPVSEKESSEFPTC